MTMVAYSAAIKNKLSTRLFRSRISSKNKYGTYAYVIYPFYRYINYFNCVNTNIYYQNIEI